ncbi:VWA domain-containing protein [Streptomyces sp. NBC_00198]|uniref:VWA domain-containing protein n=1 Tax=Streptomyces sp. NBC_00198 TaxID=2975677 RepID=UPI00225A73D9|nr:VWA domain-containing protein [Streptomyces sp. NBC_00198]MCX5285970.1 VWA domain-containing protein [Streptomyces sp. NBC_00198]MCX5286279.1 VWA domain-containing protein [Streptomyces sp. NBC_00198]
MISLRKLEETAPGLVAPAQDAAVSLRKGGLEGSRMAVYLVVDRSRSMAGYFQNGAVQHLSDRALALSTQLDDDGQVPLVMFDHRPLSMTLVQLTAYQGVVAAEHARLGGKDTMGRTRYATAMQSVIDHYRFTGAADPALVVFQTDGIPDDAYDTEQKLREASELPMFWAFVGFGSKRVGFLDSLDNIRGRAVDNASYFHAGADPLTLSDTDLFNGITHELPAWRAAAVRHGITR